MHKPQEILLFILFSLAAYTAEAVQVGTVPAGKNHIVLREILATVFTPQRQLIAAETHGVVNSIRNEMGTGFLRGEVVVRIDAREQEAILNITRAELGSAKVDLAHERRTLDRALTNRNQNAISEAHLNDIQKAHDKAKLHLQLISSRVKLEQTRREKYEIRAPFNGVLVEATPVTGQYVSPGDVVFELANVTRLRIGLELTTEELSSLLDGTFGIICNGVSLSIIAVAPTSHSNTGMNEVELSPCADNSRIGQHIGVQLVRLESFDIPEESLHRDQDGDFVLIVNEGIARRRALSNLRPDEQVIVVGGNRVAVGDPVEVIKLETRNSS